MDCTVHFLCKTRKNKIILQIVKEYDIIWYTLVKEQYSSRKDLLGR